MANRPTFILAVLLAAVMVLSGAATAAEETPDELRKKARRVTSYITLCETIGRVAIQVGGMLGNNPYDKAVTIYARDLSRLHLQFFQKLTPPEGAEALHKRVKEAIEEFASAADAHYKADYAEGHKHRKNAIQQFLKAIAEIAKMRRKGTIPGYVPASSGRK